MAITIALAGKGGVGKTTISALIINYLSKFNIGPVLAVDADPSSNLNVLLGLELESTVGDIREGLLEEVKGSLITGGAAMGSLPDGTTKREYLDYHIRTSLIESDSFDLIAMGRSEGPGCYCAVNHNLREILDSISRNYQYIIIDNEAGMEHLSRRTTRDVQHLFIVSDPTPRGLTAAERIYSISKEIEVHIEKTYLIVNRITGELPEILREKIAEIGIPLLGTIPVDPALVEMELEGVPLNQLEDNSISFKSIQKLLDRIL